MTHPESQVAQQIASYLRWQYPDVIYRFDLAADLKLTMGQARRHKALHPVRGFPDLLVLEPRGQYAGLAIELKAGGVKVYKQDGQLYADEHLAEQEAYLKRFQQKGYRAEFACGFDAAKTLIDAYLQ